MHNEAPPPQSDDVAFSFSWLSMKLLGEGLYSNAWAAVSELVANSFDAGATKVWVLLDVSSKASSTLSVLDNGEGLDEQTISDYARVGRNRRNQLPSPVKQAPSMISLEPREHRVMGRKGIGKLAALYLSRKYSILSRKNSDYMWSVDIDTQDLDAFPLLQRETELDESLPLYDRWNGNSSGTLITMQEIDLKGYGTQSLAALGSRLATQFRLDSNEDRSISFAVIEKSTDIPEFKIVQKEIAVDNFVSLIQFPGKNDRLPSELMSFPSKREVSVPIKIGNRVTYHPVGPTRKHINFDDPKVSGTYTPSPDLEVEPIPYSLEGWLGVHATISGSEAEKNDIRFVSGRGYNPSQIRLYVRDKLAVENILPWLGIRKTYANYVEGEVSFDLLDVDDLPDIATTNRQSLDEQDPRVDLFLTQLKPLVEELIRTREKISKDLRESVVESENQTALRAKEQFMEDFTKDLDFQGVAPDKSNVLLNTLDKSIRNPSTMKDLIEYKSDYKVFISHSSRDSLISSFLYKTILGLGATTNEFIFTGASARNSELAFRSNLESVIREALRNQNVYVVYVFSPSFHDSDYCMFEGGAGWALRSRDSVDILTTSYDVIPEYLRDASQVNSLVSPDDLIELKIKTYQDLVSVVNTAVAHLNKSRRIRGERSIESFPILTPATLRELELGETSIREVADSRFLARWDEIVSDSAAYTSGLSAHTSLRTTYKQSIRDVYR